MLSSPNRVVALLFGAINIAIGILGFTATAGVGLFSNPGGLLLGILEVNPAQNVLHLVVGAALVITGLAGAVWAQLANSLVGLAYLLLGLAGLFMVGSDFNVLAINAAANVFHFGVAAVLLAVGLGSGKPDILRRSPAPSA